MAKKTFIPASKAAELAGVTTNTIRNLCKAGTLQHQIRGILYYVSEADVRAYYREAVRYFEIEKRLRDTPPTDYTTRNILSYKMRVIEEHFNALLNKKYATKSKIQNAL